VKAGKTGQWKTLELSGTESAGGKIQRTGTSRRQSNYEQHLQLLSTKMYIDNNRHNAAITTATTEKEGGARRWFRPLQTLNNIKTFSFTICSVGLWPCSENAEDKRVTRKC